ncbi:MAG: Asp-tRNA(Asn)/Glu-tRNA(Gln) amidotransferase subunit GatA [Methanomassiliicoccales archaeon]|nr:Asp-tRNA(Asn)/Glu-tRNA(Gln) amidotransferase subunit GatA [Methanomassiliicoccales archaeon]
MDAAFFERLKTLNKRYVLFSELVDKGPDDHSYGFHFSAKDNLCTSNFQTRAGSRILEGYRPPFDATPVRRMREAGGFLLGKTNMDEFGFGTFSTNSAYGVPRNPFDTERSCGGSSGGAAAAACLLDGHVALGVSTGGSISCPASFCGVVGLTPTYGRVSRYGLVDYGNSLDKVGLLSRSSNALSKYFPIIAGPDPMDPTSCPQPQLNLGPVEIRSIAVPQEAMENIHPDVRTAFDRAIDTLRDSLSVSVEEVSIPSMKYALPAYYVLATSEASTNLARYCGMRFGAKGGDIALHFNDYFSRVRSANFGKEAKRRILLGTYSRMVGFRNRYYLKALAVRQTVIEDYGRVLKKHGMVATPTMPFVSPRFTDIERMKLIDMYRADFLTIPPNLAGLPHISVPCGYADSMPIGMQLVARHWDEAVLLSAAGSWESSFKYRFPEAIR